jgi:hypothetical protein
MIVPADSQDEREDREVAEKREQLLELISQPTAEGSWAWMTGCDVDGVPLVRTRDEVDRAQPVKPFPDYEYLREYVKALRGERVLFVPKSRQMMVTLTTMLDSAHLCATVQAQRVLLSKGKEADAVEILKDKVRYPWAQMPAWLQRRWPIRRMPANRVDFTLTASYIRGVTENVAASEARGGSASRTVVDEAAFQDGLEDILTAALPMQGQIVVLTTANVGSPGATCFQRYIK